MRLALFTLALLLPQPAFAEHVTRMIADTPARAAGSSTAVVINYVHAGTKVRVVECDRGIEWCFARLPARDGWVPAATLEHPVQPTLPGGNK